MKDENVHKPSVSQADIATVVAKLEKWKQNLGADEAAVIDLIIERSTDVTPELVESMRIRNAVEQEMPALLQRVVDRISTTEKPPDTWMKVGPIWVKSGGSDIEIAPRLFFERGR